MNTPIRDFLQSYQESNTLRMHMPAHKGLSYPHDITEISGADSLFEANGIIAESERNASKLYGTLATYYSTAGSTLSIQAMLYMVKKEHRTLYAVRNVHRSFLNACVLLDLNVHWIYPNYENTIISGTIDIQALKDTLKQDTSLKAVYVTSPDYYGMVADIQSISTVCKQYNAILLVDNAHGTLLNFLPKSIHPIHLGADMCSDSAHKMLPVLTGGGYLHINNRRYVPLGKEAMATFGSTSPSYLIMESLDLANQYIANSVRKDLLYVMEQISNLKKALKHKYTFADSVEPLHLTILAWKDNYSGIDLANALREYNIECEYSDAQSVVLLFSPLDKQDTFNRLYSALDSITIDKTTKEYPILVVPKLRSVLSPKEAVFSESETIPIEQADGRVCSAVKVPCPPAIPIAISGEVINAESINIFKRYGINLISVVK